VPRSQGQAETPRRACAVEEFDLVEWLEQTTDLLSNLRETLEADPTASRQVLRGLLAGPITVTPRLEAGVLYFDYAGTYRFEIFSLPKAGEGADVALLGEVRPTQTASREIRGRLSCRVQRWCPRGDSNTRHAV
jgi:hypothetical protein